MKNEWEEYLNVIESIGTILAGTLYDTEDEIFSELVYHEHSGKTYHLPRGSPSITHKLLYTILQHPVLSKSLTKNSRLILRITPSFGSGLVKDKNLGALIFREAGKEHYGHTFSLIFCDLIGQEHLLWTKSIACYCPETFEGLLKRWHEHLNEKKNNMDGTSNVLYEYIDCILRMLSFHILKENYNIWKNIVEKYLKEIAKDFLDFSKSIDLWIKLEDGGILLDPYKIYIMAELHQITNTFSIVDQNEVLKIFDKLQKIINLNGVIQYKLTQDYEGTLALLYGFLYFAKNLKEEEYNFFRENMSTFVKHLKTMKLEEIYKIGYNTSSYIFMGGQVELHESSYGGKEKVSYFPASIPFYLLRIATLIREKNNSENVAFPFSNRTIEKIFKIMKR